ncbi:Hsp70 protein [Geodermatophilus telluris]|uniref:Hsp70 protein n=1 Tax=Geodermatophilus telluris TaxID=1190417 RepID=A0A1G6UAM5_9ACTN|nr:Hsp70 family protein [Geodermatophilus telluris]SDD38440.1 Hsp70 protein [Geodermatophilus telluris]
MRDGEYGLGIDIGDRTVAAAVCGAGSAAAEPLPLGRAGTAPAALAVDDDGVRLGDDLPSRPVHVLARVGAATPVRLGARAVPAAAVAAAVVQQVRATAERREGRPDAWTVVTVPPSWAGHRRGALARALQEAGVPRFTLVSTAVAAAARHVATGALPARPTVAVYDLGASTLDLAVVGPDPDDTASPVLRHLAEPPEPVAWGGRDVDDALLGLVRRCLEAPPDERAGPALRGVCTAAKEELSERTAVGVRVDPRAGGVPETVRVTREELDELVTAAVEDSAGRLSAAVAAAGLAAADLDAVVLAGGASRMPVVAEVLSGELGRPLAREPEPGLSAALGAAGLAAAALADAGEPADATVPPTGPPDTGRHVPAPRPARRQTAGGTPRRRAGRSLAVAGLLLALLVLPPVVLGLLGSVGTATPAGEGVPVAQGQPVDAAGDAPPPGADSAPPATADGGRPATARPADTGGTGSGETGSGETGSGETGSAPTTTGGAPTGTPPGTAAGRTTAGTTTVTGTAGTPAGTPSATAGTPPRAPAPGTATGGAPGTTPPQDPSPPSGPAPTPTQEPPDASGGPGPSGTPAPTDEETPGPATPTDAGPDPTGTPAPEPGQPAADGTDTTADASAPVTP